MRYQAIMFDLDGTLADTLADIAEAANAALEELGHSPIELQKYRYLVGRGADWLFEQALGPDHQDQVEQGVARFKHFYKRFGQKHTCLYEGVDRMLDELTARQVPITVLSNKPDPAVQAAVQQLMSRWDFAAVRGHVPPTPLKPDPTSALQIAEQLKIDPEAWLYLGDTGVDMQTARSAGMFAVGALWGFREEDELRENGAQQIIAEPTQLLELL